MTGLMQRTLTQCGALCIYKHARPSPSKTGLAVLYMSWHLVHYFSVKTEGNHVLAAIFVSHCVLAGIRQDTCIHNDLHLKARAFALLSAPSFVLKLESGN